MFGFFFIGKIYGSSLQFFLTVRSGRNAICFRQHRKFILADEKKNRMKTALQTRAIAASHELLRTNSALPRIGGYVRVLQRSQRHNPE
jgi:hypothetical protein